MKCEASKSGNLDGARLPSGGSPIGTFAMVELCVLVSGLVSKYCSRLDRLFFVKVDRRLLAESVGRQLRLIPAKS